MSLPSTGPTPNKKSIEQQYFAFLKTFGIIGLALGFIIGQTSNAVVNAVVNDALSPFIGLFLPAGNLAKMNYTITAVSGQPSTFKYGDLILQMIDFAIILFILFLAYKWLSRYHLVEDKTLGPGPKVSEEHSGPSDIP